MDTLTRETNSQEKLESICLWIRANVDKTIGWEELSKASDLSHSNLIKLFKTINTTPMTYLRMVKDQERIKEIETLEMKANKTIKTLIPATLLKKFN